VPLEIGEQLRVGGRRGRRLHGHEVGDGLVAVEDPDAPSALDVSEVTRKVVLGFGYLDDAHLANLAMLAKIRKHASVPLDVRVSGYEPATSTGPRETVSKTLPKPPAVGSSV
jgi:hypothetical protein